MPEHVGLSLGKLMIAHMGVLSTFNIREHLIVLVSPHASLLITIFSFFPL